MAQITRASSELGASWFADTDRELRWANWLDPRNRNNAGWAGLGNATGTVAPGVRIRNLGQHE